MQFLQHMGLSSSETGYFVASFPPRRLISWLFISKNQNRQRNYCFRCLFLSLFYLCQSGAIKIAKISQNIEKIYHFHRCVGKTQKFRQNSNVQRLQPALSSLSALSINIIISKSRISHGLPAITIYRNKNRNDCD